MEPLSMVGFKSVANKINDYFHAHIGDGMLYETDADKDYLWELYLNSFPEGTNPMYRKRTEYDCSCCRHFIKNIGSKVFIDGDLGVHTVFDLPYSNPVLEPVFTAISNYVKSRKITDVYLPTSDIIGTEYSSELVEHTVIKYYHYFITIPKNMVHRNKDNVDTTKAIIRDTKNVFMRSLTEISMDAIDTVIDLSKSNTLYRGNEWLEQLNTLKNFKKKFDSLDVSKKDIYCWKNAPTVGYTIGRIRNHSIGVLLTEISSGADLDAAVRNYERIVAPSNYKRPKAIFTKKMLEDAQKTIAEMGYMESLPRKFACVDDITVNNLLFSNKDVAARMKPNNVFDEMLSETKSNPKKFSKVEEVPIDKFVSDILPNANDVEAFIENKHATNMVSLIAPQNANAKTMFKWNNNFSWAYAGNMADSDIRRNVEKAGGNVHGFVRFSIQWNDGSDYNPNDFDAHCHISNPHCKNSNGRHIYFGNKIDYPSRASLDVDITYPERNEPAVENIVFPDASSIDRNNVYDFSVHCFCNRGGRSGFKAELEYNGEIHSFVYNRNMRDNEKINVASIEVDSNGVIKIVDKLSSTTSSREIWNVKTNNFIPVSAIMFSPNYWDEQNGIGNKHYMFMLKGCINPEKPNGFYNEFLNNDLLKHKRVFEALGDKMAVEDVEDQLSGVGFSSTQRNELVVRVKSSTDRIYKIKF